jgi:hypothetical protein
MHIIKKCIIFETEQNYSTPSFDLGYLDKYFKNSTLSGDLIQKNYYQNTYLTASDFLKNDYQLEIIDGYKYFTHE